jgi:hypothetical protein
MSSSTTHKRKLKVYVEKVKSSHTSHWDWDYLSRDELDRITSEDPTGAISRPSGVGPWLREKACAFLPNRALCGGARSGA